MVNKVVICGVDTSKLPVLTTEKMNELFKRIEAGDETAREEFTNGNLRLVLSVIKRFGSRGENADDLFQVGCIGLIKAIDNFDPKLKVRFSTYAVPMIMGEIRRYLRDNSAVRVSRSLKDTAYKAMKAKDQLTEELDREPTISEIAEKLGVPREDVVCALDAITEPLSLYEPVFRDDGDAIYVMDQIADKRNNDEEWLKRISINEGIAKLNEREQTIIMKRFYQGRTQMEVAKEIGISQAQVSRLEKGALERIKKMI